MDDKVVAVAEIPAVGQGAASVDELALVVGHAHAGDIPGRGRRAEQQIVPNLRIEVADAGFVECAYQRLQRLICRFNGARNVAGQNGSDILRGVVCVLDGRFAVGPKGQHADCQDNECEQRPQRTNNKGMVACRCGQPSGEGAKVHVVVLGDDKPHLSLVDEASGDRSWGRFGCVWGTPSPLVIGTRHQNCSPASG